MLISKHIFQNTKNIGKILSTVRAKHTLPDLSYDFGSLEPVISAETMMAHYQGHHASYVQNLNKLEEQLNEAKTKNQIEKIISLLPALKFHGGGHINHSILWTILIPNGTSEPTGELSEAITRDFGSFPKMVEMLSAASTCFLGAGWSWLGYNKQLNRLQIATCFNQDPLWSTHGLHPLFGIDLWEHAYAMDYKQTLDFMQVRAEYVKNIFKVANWRKVEEYYEKAKK